MVQGVVVVPDHGDLRLSVRLAGGPQLDPQEVVLDALRAISTLDPGTM